MNYRTVHGIHAGQQSSILQLFFFGFRILHIFEPVPDQSANIEFVVENARASLPVAVNSGRPPAIARWTGYAFGVELFGDSAR